MTTAVGYLRVSTDGQVNSGLGLEGQRADITAAAARLGLVVSQWHADDGISGGAQLADRPGLLAAIAALRRGDVLLVAKRDRLGRDSRNIANLEWSVQRKGARVVSAAGEGSDGDGPADRVMRTVMDAFAQFEKELTAARTKAALKALRARGFRAGTVPFGFTADADGRLTPDAGEQRILGMVADLRAKGMSGAAIAATLNLEGHRTRPGGVWQQQYVSRLYRAAA